MAYKALPILFFLILSFLSTTKLSSAAGVNLTSVLEKYPDYQFTVNLMQQANLLDPIAQQGKVTILAFKEAVIDQFVKNNLDGNGTIRALQVLVLLDYIDDAKMQSATDKPVSFNSLFQTIGKAPNNMGVVNMQKGSDGKVVFGSAVSGAQMNTHIVKTVLTQPPSLSVLEIDNIIVPPGLMKLPMPDGTPAFSPPPRKPVWEDDSDIGEAPAAPTTTASAPTTSGSSSTPSTSGSSSASSTSGSASAPTTSGSASAPTTSGSSSTPSTSGSSSATVAPLAGVVHDTVAPKASTSGASAPKGSGTSTTSTASAPKGSGTSTTSTASAPKGSGTSTTSAASAPKGSGTSTTSSTSAGSPDSGSAGGPTAGGPTTTIMADGPASADGPGPSAASGVGRLMVGAGVGIGMVGIVMISV